MRLGKDPHGTPQRCDEHVSGRYSGHRHHENHGSQNRKGVHEIHQDHRGADLHEADELPLFQKKINQEKNFIFIFFTKIIHI